MPQGRSASQAALGRGHRHRNGAGSVSGNSSASKGGVRRAQSEPQLRLPRIHKDPQFASANSQAPTANLLEHRPREARRIVLETLANPAVENVARKLYRDHTKSNHGRCGFDELRQVLRELTEQLQIPAATEREAERLFKRFDLDGNGTLDFGEFFDLFLSSLRRVAFDASNLLGRDFFVTKNSGDVWSVYQQVKTLGQGSFATAYHCKNRRTGKDRVVKAVKKAQAKIPVEDIEREIMVMRQLDHPHILRLFEWFEDAGRVYLVIELLKGGTLRDVILYYQRKGQDLKEEWSRTVMKQSCQAMAYCHSLRLIHKDLKDENIMLLKKDPPFAVIIDLGISEMFNTRGRHSQVLGGTPVTMAPEVWMKNFGPKCDVWSLGCILFELLSGALPFTVRSMDPKEWIRLHKAGPDWSLIRTSQEGVRCCQSMLTFSDSKRPSMNSILHHPWFKVGAEQLKTLTAQQIAPLQAFARENDVKRYLLFEIASKLPMAEAGRVVSVFESLDVNSDASLSEAELKAAFAKLGITDEKLLGKAFKALDIDGDGFLSFSEFSAGVLLLFTDILDDGLHALFSEKDTDRDGALTRAEVQALLANSCHLAKKGPEDILNSLFSKGREKIRYDDLRRVLLGSTK